MPFYSPVTTGQAGTVLHFPVSEQTEVNTIEVSVVHVYCILLPTNLKLPLTTALETVNGGSHSREKRI